MLYQVGSSRSAIFGGDIKKSRHATVPPCHHRRKAPVLYEGTNITPARKIMKRSYSFRVLLIGSSWSHLKALYPVSEYEFQFLVDHSCGHDRQREDGLNVNCMNVHYRGGNQRTIHGSKMTATSLGQFQDVNRTLLKVGDTHEMVYSPTDAGPFCMSTSEKEKLRHDFKGGQFKPRPKAKVIKDLITAIADDVHSIMLGNESVNINRPKKKLTSNGKDISMDQLRKLCRKYEVDWREEKEIAYSTVTEDKTVADLLEDFKNNNTTVPKRYVKKTLVDLAIERGIDVTKSVEKGVTLSWAGK